MSIEKLYIGSQGPILFDNGSDAARSPDQVARKKDLFSLLKVICIEEDKIKVELAGTEFYITISEVSK